ncbi:MAG: four-carbon acid sugar kinase family protein [Chloroflexota bacterium]
MESVSKEVLFSGLPPFEQPDKVLSQIQANLKDDEQIVVVLDDDPTGTQTVYDVPVVTSWEIDVLKRAFSDANTKVFYILTNSRSLPESDAEKLNIEIAQRLNEVSQLTQRPFSVISRSDSTLRGHFPLEMNVLENELDGDFDGWIIAPFFEEGGRFTLNNVHFVAEGDQLVPAGNTPFAQDHTFGYNASNLKEWVAEKFGGNVEREITAVSLIQIRQGGVEAVTNHLLTMPASAICIVNAAEYRDIEIFVAGLQRAEKQGKQYLFRTAASFVRARAGLAQRTLLKHSQLVTPQRQRGGLVVIGSYVPKTTRQLGELKKQENIVLIELSVPELLDDVKQPLTIQQTAQEIETQLNQQKDVVLFTSRKLITQSDAFDPLTIGNIVSDCLVHIVQQLSEAPRYLIAKGGITSSDIATKGLGIKRAMVLGQILPGIPVWQAGESSRFPNLPYIVFPGNVGDDDALATAVSILSGESA